MKITGDDTRMIQVDERVFANVRGEPMTLHFSSAGILASGTALQERLRLLSDGNKRVLILELVE